MTSCRSPLASSLRLLTDEPHAIQHLLGARRSRLETPAQCGVLVLQLCHTLLQFPTLLSGRRRAFGFPVAHLRLAQQCPPAKPGQLVANTAHDGCQLTERANLCPNA